MGDFTVGSVTLTNKISEFSTDGTLHGTSASDSLISTEKAVKTYVDSQVTTIGTSSATVLTPFPPSMCDYSFTGLNNNKWCSIGMQFYVPSSRTVSTCTIIQSASTGTSIYWIAIISKIAVPINYVDYSSSEPWGDTLVCRSASTTLGSDHEYVNISLPSTELSAGAYTLWVCGAGTSSSTYVRMMGHVIASSPSAELAVQESKGTYTNPTSYTPYIFSSDYSYTNPTSVPWFILH